MQQLSVGQTFGALLRRYRTSAGLTQEELAERAGLSRRGIADLERGARLAPYADTVGRLGTALGLSEADYALLAQAARSARTSNVRAAALQPTGRPRLRMLSASADDAVSGAEPDRRHNLPVQPTSFVGRQSERVQLAGLLTSLPLVTLVGPGGVGKTRLALEVAAGQVGRWPDGVWFVELAPLGEPDLIPQAIATALGIREQRGQPLLSTLIGAMAARKLVLLLDNCEHLIDACGRVVDQLIRRCPNLHLLATSREPLRIAGERTWRVPPLQLADPDQLPNVESLTQCEAVRLFIDRAVALQARFTLTYQNASAVAQVCHGLDGIPLAIELAAARTNVLTPEQIASRLSDRFRLLTGGSRTALPRHQTLRALVDWSHDLLSKQEQVLFRRLSVFAGGCMLDTAEAVCAGGPIVPSGVLDLLGGLVDKSLVVTDEQPDGQMRYRLLETLRQYGTERLAEAGETRAVLKQHAEHYLSRAEQVDAVRRADWRRWRRKGWPWLLVEQDNLRAVLGRCRDGSIDPDRQAELGLRLCGALFWFWTVHNWASESREWHESLLALTPPQVTHARFWALLGAGLGHLGTAKLTQRFGEARELAAQLGDEQALAVADVFAALDFILQRRPTDASTSAQRALTRCRRVGPRWALPLAWYFAGQAAMLEGRLDSAAQYLDQAIAIAREIGDDHILATCLAQRGAASLRRSDQRTARMYLSELERLTSNLPTVPHVAVTLKGPLALLEGDLGRAAGEFSKALEFTSDWNQQRMCESLEGLAAVAAARGDRLLAVSLLAGVDALRSAGNYRRSASDQARIETTLADLRQALGDERFGAAWHAGQRLSIDEVVARGKQIADDFA